METFTSFNLDIHQREYPLNMSMTLGKSPHIFQFSYLSKRDNSPAYLTEILSKLKEMRCRKPWTESQYNLRNLNSD